VKKVQLTADARYRLLGAGMPEEMIAEDSTLEVDYDELATEYWVRAVPGSLTEMEDEKQIRILNQLFVPLSQALPALVQSGDPDAVKKATMALAYIVGKQIELSGASSAYELKKIWAEGDDTSTREREAAMLSLEDRVTGVQASYERELDAQTQAITQIQDQMTMLAENQQLLLEKLGVGSQPSNNGSGPAPQEVAPEANTPVPAP
jgi:hypothetical protein